MTDNELCHYGVKGMKWGVRRYEKSGGSYTKAGVKRFNESANTYDTAKSLYKTLKKNKKEIAKKVKESGKYRQALIERQARIAMSKKKGEKVMFLDMLKTMIEIVWKLLEWPIIIAGIIIVIFLLLAIWISSLQHSLI